MAEGLNSMITRHLWLVPAMSTHLIYGPLKARHDDHALAIFEAAGFNDDQADWALSTVVQFVLGRAMGQAADDAWKRRQGLNPRRSQAQLGQTVAAATEVAMLFTRLRRRLQSWRSADQASRSAQSFEFGLQTILDGLDQRLSARGSPI